LKSEKYSIFIGVFIHCLSTADEHEWALSRLFSVLPQHLDRVSFSDWDAGLCCCRLLRFLRNRISCSLFASSRRQCYPETCRTTRCFTPTILRGILARLLCIFSRSFELAWQQFDYPTAAPYLESELWPCRDRWAFTAFRPILDSAEASRLC
jgi:hypothetical protein